eukprot:TRINITY_DN6247_c0_g1_i1.p1 TRINITY_DN6247_c0_g1~~TRINITY_DN6247_c0_g1_i1.p1  ORF type:complete len:123 (-),score=49.56 TRINITY_DN6247_c0_g1_i1:54-422(-)
MCKHCVRNPFPNRDRMCLESGAYMVNMSKCSNCSKNNLKVEQVPADMLEEDISDDDTEEETETVTYNHVCADCNHVVSRHKYKFWLEDGRQEYRMDCLLCGFAEDSISVMPTDPRKASSMEY